MKKIYYIPGIFSIILLPILGIWYMNKYDYFTQLRSIDFTYMDFVETEQFNKELGYDVFITKEFLTQRFFKEVTLNNDKNSKNTFKYIDQFVNDVVQTKDTINGLKIHFEKEATYNEFIKVLNIFNEREAELYILDNNTMYFLGRDYKLVEISDDEEGLPSPFIECGTIWANDIVNDEKTDIKSFINNLKIQFLQNKIIYSTYIIFVLLIIVSNCIGIFKK